MTGIATSAKTCLIRKLILPIWMAVLGSKPRQAPSAPTVRIRTTGVRNRTLTIRYIKTMRQRVKEIGIRKVLGQAQGALYTAVRRIDSIGALGRRHRITRRVVGDD